MSQRHLNEVTEDDDDDYDFSIDDDHGGGIKHEDTEGVWLISYADLMTLLVGFFALLVAMSSFDEEKFAETGQKTAEYFGGKVEKPFEEIGESVKELIKSKGLESKVNVEVKPTLLNITFEGTFLFTSGSFGLKPDSNSLMNELISVLDKKTGDKKILVEGHTDNVPINKGVIASNWELSSLRANSVARLFENFSFSKAQILTIGFAETRPLAPNIDESGNAIVANQEKNR